ncbi:MAG: helix-turn-helix domain-containing protein [Thermoleophilia bacterium]|nr:helix-turn-helix domain-containing protein [Thermoleophilia bacterium]
MPVPRSDLSARLKDRRAEIELALLNRCSAVSGPGENKDLEYQRGFRQAISTAFDYSLRIFDRGTIEPPTIPALLLVQARLAARCTVGLDTVLRRYIAGSALLDDYILEEIEQGHLQQLLKVRSAALEHLLAEITTEYEHERSSRATSREAQMTERVRKLLRGEAVDPAPLQYDLDAQHIGMIAQGSTAGVAVRRLAEALACRVMIVRSGDEIVWGWMGRRATVDRVQVTNALSSVWPDDVPLALGEPDLGIAGWRRSHHQAQAAFPVASKERDTVVHYGDVCLLAAVLRDDLLSSSLRELYLAPLECERDGGEALRTTLRAYFAANRNGASTAFALGVSRQTVSNRLRTVEERLGRPLPTCAPAVEAALALDGAGPEATR